MKQPQSPPTPCTITGCVYEEDGTTLAVGPVVYLLVTHGGVESYPLSDLLSDGDATPGCFAFDIKQARSTVTHDLFSSIDPGDPIQVMALDCGNYRAESNLAFNGCFNNIGFLTLEYTLPGTTTTSTPVQPPPADSSTTTTADPSTTTTADSSTTTTVDSSTTTTVDSSTTTTADCTRLPSDHNTDYRSDHNTDYRSDHNTDHCSDHTPTTHRLPLRPQRRLPLHHHLYCWRSMHNRC